MGVCVPLFMCWSPNPRDDLWRWGLWEWRGHEGGARMSGISALIREQLSLSPCHVRTQRDDSLQARKKVLTRTRPCWTLTSDIQSPELWGRSKRLLWKPPSLGCLALAVKEAETTGQQHSVCTWRKARWSWWLTAERGGMKKKSEALPRSHPSA